MKVLLINPPWYRLLGSAFDIIPMGLCYLTAVIRERGHDALVYNADYVKGIKSTTSVSKITSHFENYKRILADLDHPIWREVEEKVASLSPDLVGVNVMTPKYKCALNIARIVKQIDANIPVIFGGPHATIMPEEVVRESVIDVVVRGEGEYTFADLVDHIERESDLDGVLGITYKSEGAIAHNPPRPLIKNLDELPFPARDLLVDKEIYPTHAFGSIFSTRGCPYRCIFCVSHKIWTRKVRFRSPENIVAEIKHVQERYRTKKFDFEDDTFTIDKKRVIKLCKLIRREKLDITWSCTTRADLLSEDLLSAMKSAGCLFISIGVESGDEETLKKIKKGVTLKQCREARKLLKKHGICFGAYWMIGFPWETLVEIEKTINFMREMDADFNIYSIVTPYPASELYDLVLKDGLIPSNLDYDNFFHQSPEMMLSRKLSVNERRQIIMRTERIVDELNKEKAKKMAREKLKPWCAFRLFIEKEYYKRPHIALQNLWETLKTTF